MQEVVFAYRLDRDGVEIVNSNHVACTKGDWLTGTQIDGNGELIAEQRYLHVAFKVMYEMV
jgi:hypothetical protein